MSDAQLSQEAERAGGRVILGLKAPGATAGVDGRGRPLVSSTELEKAKTGLRSLGLSFEYEFKKQPAVIASLRPTPSLVALLRQHPNVDYIEPDVPSGGILSQQTTWNVTRVQATSAWSRSTGSGVKLLVLDTGAGPHQDLSISVAFRCVSPTLPVNDVRGHGTAVAGVAAAVNNTLDVVGVAPGVSLWSANVFDATGFSVLASEVACALDVARLNDVFAVNMSFFLSPSTAVTDAIVGAYDDGMYLVSAAGNNGQLSGFIPYPASLADVVAVAALDTLNVPAYYSSFGSKIEIAAPAEIATTTTLPNASACPSTGGGTIGPCNGTSIAAPHVAAAAAILKAYNPTWTNVFIRDRLNCAALYLGDPIYYGNGLLRINSALDGICDIDPY